jgi:hypothetical protein
MNKLPFALLASMCLCGLGGCVHYGQFRDDKPGRPESQSIWRPDPSDPKHRSNYYLGFVEVDEFGEMFNRNQLVHALNLIRTAKENSQTKVRSADGTVSSTHNVIVVTFIHGWKNNASDSSGNVWGFRDALGDIAKTLSDAFEDRRKAGNTLPGEEPEPVVGIYIGWRGAVTNLGLVKEFTFFNRRDAAARIPGSDLTEMLSEIAHWTKACIPSAETPEQCALNNPEVPGTGSLSVIVGHSFGGLVLERTLTQAVAAQLLSQEAERLERQRRNEEQLGGNLVKPVTDLIVLVNEAAPATESKQLLDLLLHHRIQLCVGNEVDPKTGRCMENQPLFLSITSTGDWATGLTLPIGQGASSLFRKNFRTYYDPKCDDPDHKVDPSCNNPDPEKVPIRGQRTYYLHSTAHLPPLFSHFLGPESDPNIQQAVSDARAAGRDRDVHSFESTIIDQSTHRKKRYYIVPLLKVYNTTPYWVMQMGTEFVPDHSQIFRPEFRQLLQQFLLQRLDMTQPGTPLRQTYIK